MSKRNKNSVFEARLYAHEHYLLGDVEGQMIEECLKNKIEDKYLIKELFKRVDDHKKASALHPMPFKIPIFNRGKEFRGVNTSGSEIHTPYSYREGHSCSLGATGSGKSNASSHRVTQLAPVLDGLWIIDVLKKEMRKTAHLLMSLGYQVSFVNAENLTINPLQVPRYKNAKGYALAVSESLTHAFNLPQRAQKLLHITILRLYKSFGILDGGTNFPTLFELFVAIKQVKKSHYQARMSVLDAMEPILEEMGSALSFRHGWDSHELAGTFVYFDFTEVSTVAKSLIINSLLLSEFTSRVAQGLSNVPLQLYACIDEAGSIIDASHPNKSLINNFNIARGGGMSIDVSSTVASIDPTVLSNCNNLQLGCSGARELSAMSREMGLNAEQEDYILHKLQIGTFVEKVSKEWRYPYLVKVPLIQFPENMSSGDEGLGALEHLPVEPTLIPPEFDTSVITVNSSPSDASPPEYSLSEVELRYCKVVVANPTLSSSKLFKIARISSKQALSIRKRLVQEGFLREHSVQNNSRGRSSIVVEALQPALDALAKDRK